MDVVASFSRLALCCYLSSLPCLQLVCSQLFLPVRSSVASGNRLSGDTGQFLQNRGCRAVSSGQAARMPRSLLHVSCDATFVCKRAEQVFSEYIKVLSYMDS